MSLVERDASLLGWVPLVIGGLWAWSGCGSPPAPSPTVASVQPSESAAFAPSPSTPPAPPAPVPDSIAWRTGVAALEQARERDGSVMAVFRADWSASSMALWRRLEASEPVRRAAVRVTAVTIDLTETSQDTETLAARYEVDHVPTILLFHDGVEAARLEGEIATDELVDELERVGR